MLERFNQLCLKNKKVELNDKDHQSLSLTPRKQMGVITTSA